MSGIFEAFRDLKAFSSALDNQTQWELKHGYYTPGYVAVLAAFLKYRNTQKNCFRFASDQNAGYFSALGLARVVWGQDDYTYLRQNAGTNYAELTALSSREAVDVATEQINGCLRKMAANAEQDYSQSAAFQELMHVVGELHDNVWSHGLDTGFSTAQRRTNQGRSYLEFGLADTGMGFLEELKASGIARKNGITEHAQAIDWCVQEGNSSKLADHEDDWGQSVPADFVGRNPYGRAVRTRRVDNGNHHQGLGLAKLLSLATEYEGTLYLASGDSALCLRNGTLSHSTLPIFWKGVAMSLTLEEAKMVAAQAPEVSAEITEIMTLLRG